MTYLTRFRQALEQRQGQTANELAAGGDLHAVQRALWNCWRDGELFRIKATPSNRYFSTAEARDAMAEQVAADGIAHKARLKAEKLERERPMRREKYRQMAAAKALLPKPPKPRKEKVLPKGKAPVVLKHDDRPVVIPEHVKVQVLKGYDGTPKWARERTWQ